MATGPLFLLAFDTFDIELRARTQKSQIDILWCEKYVQEHPFVSHNIRSLILTINLNGVLF